jgi:hypothetical protein
MAQAQVNDVFKQGKGAGYKVRDQFCRDSVFALTSVVDHPHQPGWDDDESFLAISVKFKDAPVPGRLYDLNRDSAVISIRHVWWNNWVANPYEGKASGTVRVISVESKVVVARFDISVDARTRVPFTYRGTRRFVASESCGQQGLLRYGLRAL